MAETVAVRSILVWIGLTLSVFNFIMFCVALNTGKAASFVEHANIYVPSTASNCDEASCVNLTNTIHVDKYGPFVFCRYWGYNDPQAYCFQFDRDMNITYPWPCNNCVSWGSTFGKFWSSFIANGGSYSIVPGDIYELPPADTKFVSKQQGSAAFGVIGAVTAAVSALGFLLTALAHTKMLEITLPVTPSKVAYLFALITTLCCFIVVTIWGSVYNNFQNSHFSKPAMPHQGLRLGAAVPLVATTTFTTFLTAVVGYFLSKEDRSSYETM